MEPVIQSQTYLAGFCWADVSKRKLAVHLCNDRAAHYEMYRCSGSETASLGAAIVWLCAKHAKQAQNNGYTLKGVR